MADKKSSADDKIERTMELKKKRSANVDGLKGSRATGSPEIDLVGLSPGKELKPLVVRDSDEILHVEVS